MAIDLKNTRLALQAALDGVVMKARANLAVTKSWTQNDGSVRRKRIETTGKLWKSLQVSEVKDEGNFLSVTISMEDYGAFIDQGVSGTRHKTPTPSPFSFKNDGVSAGMQYSIFEWMRKKGVRMRDLGTGKFKKGKMTEKSYESLAYVIARSVKRKGINQTFFLTKPLDATIDTLDVILADALMKDLEEYLKEQEKNNK